MVLSNTSSVDSTVVEKQKTKSPLMSCFPGVLTKLSRKQTIKKSEYSSYKDSDSEKTQSGDEAAPISSASMEFNDVINFAPEEIIPTKYSLDHDKVNDEEIYSKHSYRIDNDLINRSKVDTTQRLYKLRQLMLANGVDVYIVPSEDAHQSEYTAPCDNRREYISGFDGSAGIAIISLEKAALSTDSRYFLEAEKALDDNWILLRQGVSGYPTWQEWALQQVAVSQHKTLSLDARVTPLIIGKYFEEKCPEINCSFKPIFHNFVDEIWDGRPQMSGAPVYELPYKYTGCTTKQKISKIREGLIKDQATGVIVTKLDDIAWTLNLRGSDIDHIPVFFAFLIITHNEVSFYIESKKLTPKVENYLKLEIMTIRIKDYSEFWIDLDALSINFENYYYMLSNDVSYGLIKKLSIINYKLSGFIEELKSVKSATELYGMKLAHVKDGISLVRYFAWLREKLVVEQRTLNEYQGALKCEYYRSLMANYKGTSFQTISASGANAASNHYEPSFETNSLIDPDAIYLCDSGAQYVDGTTDITRTLHFGTPTTEQKIAYTAVLKGHVSLAMASFPKSATGRTLDTLARVPLWQEGLDYRHGTGHGIGSFLSVHEGPIYFGRDCHFQVGQVISNEPGYYKDYEYGIRIESDMEIRAGTFKDFNGDTYMKFGYLTLCPFDPNLIDKSRLSSVEIGWINAYHTHVRNLLTPYLMKFNDLRAAKWLYKQTERL